MFNFLNPSTWSAPSSYLGIDIGTTSIKIAEVSRGKQLPEIVNYGLLEASDYLGRSNSALQTSSLKLFDKEVAELLALLVKRTKIRAREALVSLPIFSSFRTVLDFPEMSDEEISKNITFQAKQYVPLPVSEVVLEWSKVGTYDDEKGRRHHQVFLIAVPQEQIQKYRRIIESAGLHLRALEMESVSLARILVGTDPSPAIIVDVGSRSTGITFVEKGHVKLASQSDFAGASLTQALSSSLNINPRRAEELKREKGVVGGGVDYELSTIILPFLDVIINEVKKASFNYASQFPLASKPERVILTGGGANLKGIDRYFKRELDVPVVRAAPFTKFSYPPLLEPLVQDLNPLLGVSLGLALQEFA